MPPGRQLDRRSLDPREILRCLRWEWCLLLRRVDNEMYVSPEGRLDGGRLLQRCRVHGDWEYV